MTDYDDVPKSSTATDTVLAYSMSIASKTTHIYTIEIKYLNSTTVNQSEDMNSTISGNLYISKGSNPPLTVAILRDNGTISERTDFSVTNVANTTGTIYKTNKTEDGSLVYYYSGNTTNNWVNFGGFYWRIIRTNEDGSVRLLYTGTSPSTSSGYIDISYFDAGSDTAAAGYMQGGNTSLADNRTNTTSSTIKGVIDTWYQNNLLESYDKYISKSAIYCNDRSISSGNWSSNQKERFSFGATSRYGSPNYKCGANKTDGLFESTQAIEDKFSASTTGGGNGQLTYPIALMTVDEVVFAGGKYYTELSSPYAWYYTNSLGNNITDSYGWWTMSPEGFGDGDGPRVFYVYGIGKISYYNTHFRQETRPVISIDPCAKFSGSGTSTDPYTLDTISSTCS